MSGLPRTLGASGGGRRAKPQVNADWNAVDGLAHILNKPTLGSAAAQDSSAFATAAQGGKADTALQPVAIGVSVQAYSDTLQNTSATFTATLLNRLNGIAAGAEVNVNADWNAGSGDAQILNKPTLGTAASKNTGVSAGNVPLLDGSGLLDTSILPAIAITDTNVVASQAAMLALTAQKGDIAIRTDLNKSFSLATNSPTTLADWKELLTPTNAVLSVAGLTGAISASALKTALAIAVADITDASANGRSLISAANYAAMRTLMNLVPGTDIQAYSAKLANIAGLSPASGDIIVWNGTAYVSQAPAAGGSMTLITGYVDSSTLSTGTGEDIRYFDVTVASQTVAKVMPFFVGGASDNGDKAAAETVPSTNIAKVLPRMTSATNLRLSIPSGAGLGLPAIRGRYYLWISA